MSVSMCCETLGCGTRNDEEVFAPRRYARVCGWEREGMLAVLADVVEAQSGFKEAQITAIMCFQSQTLKGINFHNMSSCPQSVLT